MFEYFPGNHAWSSDVNLALMAGGCLSDIGRWLGPLRAAPSADLDAWTAAWSAMAHHQELLAETQLKAGFPTAASAHYLRAAVYHANGQRRVPIGPVKSEGYAAALQAFGNAVDGASVRVERVQVESPDGPLPGYLIAPDANEPQPVVIVYGGLDLIKEQLYAIIGETFARRGITALVMDTPGVGEPLRLRGIPSRPDYEVTTRSIIDHLEVRHNVDAHHIAVLGVSAGGYYAARSAAFEPRISACVAWAASWDWGAVWQRRWEQRLETDQASWFLLPWVMGTPTVEKALERVQQWSLVDVWPQVRQPLLILHGERDRQLPVEDAIRAFEAAGSTDKRLHIFTGADGGAEHIQSDDPGPALAMIADWISLNLPAAAHLRARSAV